MKMEILNLNSTQKKPQEKVKISCSQFYGGSVKSVKQRAHKFNEIANGNLASSNNIPSPNKTSSSSVTKVESKTTATAKKSSTTSVAAAAAPSSKVDHNHNIQINIVNKYTTKNATHVATKNIHSALEKTVENGQQSVTKTDINHIASNDNNNNIK